MYRVTRWIVTGRRMAIGLFAKRKSSITFCYARNWQSTTLFALHRKFRSMIIQNMISAFWFAAHKNIQITAYAAVINRVYLCVLSCVYDKMTIAYVTLLQGNKVYQSYTVGYQTCRTNNQIDNRHINVDYICPCFFNIPERVSVIELEWRTSGTAMTKHECIQRSCSAYDTFMQVHIFIHNKFIHNIFINYYLLCL